MLSETTALILCGGLGTRLRPVLADRPKALAPVCGRPFLSIILDKFSSEGVTRAVLCTGHLGEQIEEVFGPCYKQLKLSYCREQEPLGTAGALRLAASDLESEWLLAANGDSYVDADLRRFAAWHFERGFDASLVLVWAASPDRYGTVEVDDDGRVVAFREKIAGSPGAWINAGVYLFPRRLLLNLPAGRPLSLEKDVLPEWVADGIGGYRDEAAFIDIGTPEAFAEAEKFFAGLEGRR